MERERKLLQIKSMSVNQMQCVNFGSWCEQNNCKKTLWDNQGNGIIYLVLNDIKELIVDFLTYIYDCVVI